MRLLIAALMIGGCTVETKDSDTGAGSYGGEYSNNDSDTLSTTWASIQEGYCTIAEMAWGSTEFTTVISPISNGPGSSDDQSWTSSVGGLLEVSCDAYVTPQYDPQITVDVSGCLQVYCDGVGEDAGCDRNEIHVYIYARGAYGGGNQASDCELDSTIGAGY